MVYPFCLLLTKEINKKDDDQQKDSCPSYPAAMCGELMTTDVTGLIFLRHFHSARWAFFCLHLSKHKGTKSLNKKSRSQAGFFII
jgi:hypothetical protein